MIGNSSENTNIIYVNVPTNQMHHQGAELTWQANSKMKTCQRGAIKTTISPISVGNVFARDNEMKT